MRIKEIEIQRIKADQRAQPRLSLSPEVIGQYTESMEAGDEFPPLVVFEDENGIWLADGFHRYYAAIGASRTRFLCEVHAGGLREAILHSCGANAAHGLARTPADKRRAVEILLADPEWSKWSSREIGRQCRVAHSFVEKVRKDVEKANGFESISSRERLFVHHESGEPAIRTLPPRPVAPPPSRPAALPDIEPRRLAALLHDVEHHIDMLGDPEDVARRFPDDQWYFFPIDKLEHMADFMRRLADAWSLRIRERASA